MKKWILTLAALWIALFLRHLAAQVSINPAGASIGDAFSGADWDGNGNFT